MDHGQDVLARERLGEDRVLTVPKAQRPGPARGNMPRADKHGYGAGSWIGCQHIQQRLPGAAVSHPQIQNQQVRRGSPQGKLGMRCRWQQGAVARVVQQVLQEFKPIGIVLDDGDQGAGHCILLYPQAPRGSRVSRHLRSEAWQGTMGPQAGPPRQVRALRPRVLAHSGLR